MSIICSVSLSREDIIQRIMFINSLITQKEYREIELNTMEEYGQIPELIKQIKVMDFSKEELEKYTNQMLLDIINQPIYRKDRDEHYHVKPY